VHLASLTSAHAPRLPTGPPAMAARVTPTPERAIMSAATTPYRPRCPRALAPGPQGGKGHSDRGVSIWRNALRRHPARKRSNRPSSRSSVGVADELSFEFTPLKLHRHSRLLPERCDSVQERHSCCLFSQDDGTSLLTAIVDGQVHQRA
jgi:hypothetical protein